MNHGGQGDGDGRVLHRTSDVARLALLLWVPTWAVFAVLAVFVPHPARAQAFAATGSLVSSATVVVALIAGVFCWVRWQHDGQRVDLIAGVAVVMFGALRVGVAEVGAAGPPGPNPTRLAAEALLVTLGVLAMPDGLRRHERRERWASVAVLVGLAGIAVLVLMSPSVGAALLGQPAHGIPRPAHLLCQAAVCAFWLLLGRIYWRESHAGGSIVGSWVAGMFVGLAQCRLVLGIGSSSGLWAVAARVFRLEAVLLVVVGLYGELQDSLARAQVDVHRLLDERRTLEARAAERRHDVRAALFSVASTVTLLERHRDNLDDDDLATLGRALRAEVSLLHEMVGDAPPDEVAEFPVDEVLATLVVGARAAGQSVTLDCDRDLRAIGRAADTAEGVRNLLDNARVHAPGAPVTVSCRRRADTIEITVADVGAGIPPSERDDVFERGHRGSHAAPVGSGLGLYVARRLARDQGGDLRLDLTDHGASFTISVPAAASENTIALTGPAAG